MKMHKNNFFPTTGSYNTTGITAHHFGKTVINYMVYILKTLFLHREAEFSRELSFVEGYYSNS